MRCWPWTCSLCHIAQLSAALLPDPSSCLAFRSEVEYRIRNSWDLGLVFPISFLCDVMGNSSSSGCDSCSLPITSKATHLTLTVPSKQKNLFDSTGRSKKQNKTLLSRTWNNLDGLEIVHVWSSFKQSPRFCWDATEDSAPLQSSTPAFLSVSLALWTLGRYIPRSSLLICQSKQKRSSWTDFHDF